MPLESGSHQAHPHSFARLQNTNLGEPESHTNPLSFSDQIDHSRRIQGQRSRGNTGQIIRKQRGRSPRRRGAERLQLAVSSRHLNNSRILVLIASELGTGPTGN